MNQADQPLRFFKPWVNTVLVVILFLAALGIRLYDLTDLPNDFYMVRQYRDLIISRAMYYAHLPSAPEWQRQVAVEAWDKSDMIEPPILETITSLTYHVIGEHIWVGRVYSSLFWVLGGIAILLLARDLSMRNGGLIAVLYYLFVPFGITAGRALMPDPLMVAMIAWAVWALHRWEVRRTWKSAVLAGILTGLAILVKSVAVFPLAGAALGLVLSRGSLKRVLTDKQVWVVAGITAIPTLIYYFYGTVIVGTLGSQFALRFFPSYWKDPSFYGRWIEMAVGFSGFAAMFASLTGILFFPSKNLRLMAIGLWVGYIVCGFVFPYHFLTHNYYHLPLLFVVTVGLIPFGELVVGKIAGLKGKWWRLAFVGILLLGVTLKIWDARTTLARDNYRSEVAYWQDLGNLIGHDKAVISLSGDYGDRLTYFGWVISSQWPTVADEDLRALAGQSAPDFASTFAEETKGKDLFVITSLPELNNQPKLHDYLTSHYPLVAQGDGYLIFNLRQPLKP